MIEQKQIVLGRGDYAVGGACSVPFVQGSRKRRPMVFGEMMLDPSRKDAMIDGMFSGRSSDPMEWAVIWRQLGADGICIRTEGVTPEEAAAAVKAVSDETRMPLAVDGTDEVLSAVSDAVKDSILVLIGPGRHGDHVTAWDGGDMLLIKGGFPDIAPLNRAEEHRTAGLNGEGPDSPILFDVTSVWDDGFPDVRTASMVEGEAALTAMLSCADALIIRGPGAADMARVYGEELADL